MNSHFEVGNRVRYSGGLKGLRNQCGTITDIPEPGRFTVNWDNGARLPHYGKYLTLLTNTPRPAAPADAPKVDVKFTPATAPGAAIVALVEDGIPRPAEKPVVHATIEKAVAEAKRLAKVHVGKSFTVLVLAADKVTAVRAKTPLELAQDHVKELETRIAEMDKTIAARTGALDIAEYSLASLRRELTEARNTNSVLQTRAAADGRKLSLQANAMKRVKDWANSQAANPTYPALRNDLWAVSQLMNPPADVVTNTSEVDPAARWGVSI